ncbi:hypothetical protein BC628DRAFT_1316638 [Trametes gibbosa]|nr:hypothetical protein BC628DRAFT_619841 [Trametes gibbosa]KAI0828241.1 hypothetical protein BC628DRAFT_1316638 [Trametes gibbosa]
MSTHALNSDTAESLAKLFPLDEKLYSLEGEELEFMKEQTGIEDENELKRHIIAVAKDAFAVFPFPCIRRYAFIKFKLSRLPGYDYLLKLGREREGAILLDIGCCFGNDVRNAAANGYPTKQIVASDLHGDYWTLGHKLYRSTEKSFPARFVAGDAFNPSHLAIFPPVYSAGSEPSPELSTLTSLNPLHGHVAAIHASSLFHLFNEEEQAHLARALAGLLSPLPGSMVIGTHYGASEKGLRTDAVQPSGGASAPGGSLTVFCHSPESWVELWDGEVFKRGTVKVEASLIEHSGGTVGVSGRIYFLQWCVTRL